MFKPHRNIPKMKNPESQGLAKIPEIKIPKLKKLPIFEKKFGT